MTTTYDFEHPAYFDDADLRAELDRVFELCHSCRLCSRLCPSFDTLLNFVDTETDGIDVRLARDRQDRVVDECYQCKLCYIKCPYIPPHEWQLDFPRLMLRALGVRTGGHAKSLGDKLLAATTAAGRVGSATTPLSNASLKPGGLVRKGFETVFGISARRLLPSYNKVRFSKWWKHSGRAEPLTPVAGPQARAPSASLEPTKEELIAGPPDPESPNITAADRPKTAKTSPPRQLTFFPTCLIEYQDAEPGKAVVRVLEKNGCDIECARGDRCCGMPLLDAGDIKGFLRKARRNVAELLPAARGGRLIVIAEPTCNYVLRKEYPAYLKTPEAREVADAVVDPAEYLVRLQDAGGINEEFVNELGTIAYHIPCHLRAQQQGYKSVQLLEAVPGTKVHVVEGCAGIDGTWGYRAVSYELAKGIVEHTAHALRDTDADLVVGDCLLADVAFEEEGLPRPIHPMQALARAYGIVEG